MPASVQPLSQPRSGRWSPGEHEHLAVGRPRPETTTAEGFLGAALDVVLEEGHAVGGYRPSREVLDQQLILRDPRARVAGPGSSTFSLRVAVARLIWHLAASSELDQIAHYEPRAREFSDDGRIVPGSNVGARAFGATSGVDQYHAAIQRLRLDPASRRASLSVWEPHDATRASRDIPCTLSMTFHVRSAALVSTVVMRSNNALRLLPYNLFELSMLAELAATELDVSLGPYVHLVNSLHVFDDERARATEVRSRMLASTPSFPMPPMPATPDPRQAINTVVRLERGLRAAAVAGSRHRVEAVLHESARALPTYWHMLVLVLATGGAARTLVPAVVDRALECLEPWHPFRAHLAAL